MEPAAWLVACGALLPAAALAVLLRYVERRHREPWTLLLHLFAYGALVAAAYGTVLGHTGAPAKGIAYAVLWAPVLEEPLKGVGLRFGRRHLDEEEDGILHGAAIALGFAAAENVLYGLQAMQAGTLGGALLTVAARLGSSTLLHVAATAMLGWAYGRVVAWGASAWTLVPMWLTVMAVHSLYNGLMGLTTVWGVACGIALAVAILAVLRHQVRRLDAMPVPEGPEAA